jgi:beta-glucanase (GH16 family)
MVFADEFDGTSLNTNVWTAASGARRDAVNTPAAVAVGGGNMTITTYTQNGTHYTGFVGSRDKFDATYGYWEARINFQDSPGMWSAFWVHSPTIGNPVGNPAVAGTEIDIVEHRVRDSGGADISNRSVSNLHWDGYGANHRSVGSGLVNNPSAAPLQGNFHLYALQWDPSGYRFSIDGVQVYATTQAVSQRSQFIYLTSEVENASWAGSIPTGGYGSQAASTTRMLVDYVRVWQRPVSDVPDLETTEGAAPTAVPVTVAQRRGATTTLTATSSNPDLVPVGNVVFGGSGANRTVTVTPAAGRTGAATITLTAADGTVSGTDTFAVTVNAGSFGNGGFEADSAGWSRYGGAQVSATGARSGGKAMRIAGGGGAEQVVTGLEPNTTYVLGGFARVTAAGAPAVIGVKDYGGSQRTTTLTGAGYAAGTVTFTTGPTATQAKVFAYRPDGSAGDAYFDDLYLFRVEAEPAGFAGGGFEAPAVGAGQFAYAPAGPPWAFAGGAGVSGNASGFTAGNPAAPEGAQVAFLQGAGSAAQTFTLAAGTYTVSFRAAQRGNYNPGGPQAVRVLVDGVERGTFTPSGAGYQQFTTAAFAAGDGTHTLRFEGLAAGDATALLDDVRVTPASPPPATVLAGGGFEAPAVGAGQFAYAPGGTPWAYAGGAGVSGNGSGFTAGNPSAPEGGQVLFLQNGGSASQPVSLTAGTYTLTFRAAQRGNYNPGGPQTVRAQLAGTARTFTPAGSDYGTYTGTFTVGAAGTYTLVLDGLTTGDATALLDDILLTLV